MGCGSSKDETTENDPSTSAADMAHGGGDNNAADKVDFKSRFERKMCLAKETPEPEFDLSDCNLKAVPPGVFVLCRVLRKETLDLSRNRLNNISSGGTLSDLSLLCTLNLRQNKLTVLPEDLSCLENLRELLLSDNLLKRLPKTIRTLSHLEHLDISKNNIATLDEINCMPALRILNISQNSRLQRLPTTLSTCDNLRDLVLEESTIDWPPTAILSSGTENILKFLTTGEFNSNFAELAMEAEETTNISREDALMQEIIKHEQRTRQAEPKRKYEPDGYGSEDMLIEQLQLRQQKQQKELLQVVLQQQNETETLVNKVHQQKDQERDILIKDIKQAEENANLLIEQLLALRSGPDPALLEKEQAEEQRLLEKLHLKHSELRKQEILSTMMQVLHEEDSKLYDYQQQRNLTSKDILEREVENNNKLGDCFRHYEQNRNDIIQKIYNDEELQKQAVVTLIEMNDARTWGLMEQLKIVEAQLANMTQLEIDKKTFTLVKQTNEFAEKRARLTCVLMDLLDQQEIRKQQLLDTLRTMEQQKRNDEEDFWLLQYQRLIDSRPLEFSLKTTTIDPLLGYNFLVNGVIHCLPFLQKLWQNTEVNLEKLTADNLRNCGVHREKDQKLILKSISDFLRENESSQGRISCRPSAPDVAIPAESNVRPEAISERVADSAPQSNMETLAECVVCMERSVKIIFLPCGHMCCCFECQETINLCPMCRSTIDRKIKVLQP